jgi:parallel beta-helix repeat protein
MFLTRLFSIGLCSLLMINNSGNVMAQTQPLTEIKANGSDQTENVAKRITELGPRGLLILPRGTIGVSANVLKMAAAQRLTMRGAGRDQTIVKVLGDLSEPLFQTSGEKGKMASYLVVEDITFDGENHAGTCFHLEGCMWGNFTRVEFRDFKGAAIHGRMFWDTVFNDCFFVRCGDAQKEIPAVLIEPIREEDYYSFSNNISFMACRWEANPYVSLMLRKGTRKVKLVGCKFHGTLPDAQPYEHIVMDNADSNIITATNLTQGGKSAIRLNASYGNVISSNLIGANKEYGVQLVDCRDNTISSNSFSTGREPANEKGAWIEEGECRGNIFEGNAGKVEPEETGKVLAGPGNPEGKVEALPGTVYICTDNGAKVRLYIKSKGQAKVGWMAVR